MAGFPRPDVSLTITALRLVTVVMIGLLIAGCGESPNFAQPQGPPDEPTPTPAEVPLYDCATPDVATKAVAAVTPGPGLPGRFHSA